MNIVYLPSIIGEDETCSAFLMILEDKNPKQAEILNKEFEDGSLPKYLD